VADVEWGPGGIFDQVVRHRHADEDERDPIELRIHRAILIEKADGREEVVREIEPQRRVDLVDKEHEPFAPFDQRDFTQVPDQAVRVGVARMGVPPVRGAGAQVELFLDPDEEALVPLVRRGLGAELGEVDDDRPGIAVREAFCRTVHEARLAHLARRQDVGEIPRAAVLQQIAVRVALEIHAAACLHGPAGDEREGLRHRF
jgi:hypothetical protein